MAISRSPHKMLKFTKFGFFSPNSTLNITVQFVCSHFNPVNWQESSMRYKSHNKHIPKSNSLPLKIAVNFPTIPHIITVTILLEVASICVYFDTTSVAIASVFLRSCSLDQVYIWNWKLQYLNDHQWAARSYKGMSWPKILFLRSLTYLVWLKEPQPYSDQSWILKCPWLLAFDMGKWSGLTERATALQWSIMNLEMPMITGLWYG